jgi:hypothetical protein
VRDSTPTRALAEVVSGSLGAAATGAWAFVTERTFGDLALRVRLDPSLTARDRTGLERALVATGIVTLVDESADVVISDREGRPEARITSDDLVLATGAERVVAAVPMFAQNRYLRRLAFDGPEIDIALELTPGVQLVRRPDGSQDCSPGAWDRAEARPEYLGGGQWRLAPGALYRVRARNVGERRAFIHFVDLRPRGEIDVMAPAPGRPPEQLEAGAEMDLGCYRVSADDVGHEVLKLFATGTAQDLRPWFQSARTRSEAAELATSREISIHIEANVQSNNRSN